MAAVTGRNYAAESEPAHNPQFGRRWAEPPHCDGFQSVGEAAAQVVADLRFRRQVQRLHQLGPRVLGEYLAELGVERDIGTIIDRKLDTYAELDPETLQAAGGDDFWQPPIHGIDHDGRPIRPDVGVSSDA